MTGPLAGSNREADPPAPGPPPVDLWTQAAYGAGLHSPRAYAHDLTGWARLGWFGIVMVHFNDIVAADALATGLTVNGKKQLFQKVAALAAGAYGLDADGVAEALSRLPGVDSHTEEQVEGRTRVQLTVAGDDELRPEISRMANEHQWVLWELHRGQASLEQLFRELTADADESEDEGAPASDEDSETE